MKATASPHSDVTDFYRTEIVITRMDIGKARKDAWREKSTVRTFQEQKMFSSDGKKPKTELANRYYSKGCQQCR